MRELKNTIARAVILSKSTSLTKDDLPNKMPMVSDQAAIRSDMPILKGLPEQGVTLRQMECELIQKTLEKFNGNKSLAAQSLGISKKHCMKKLNAMA